MFAKVFVCLLEGVIGSRDREEVCGGSPGQGLPFMVGRPHGFDATLHVGGLP